MQTLHVNLPLGVQVKVNKKIGRIQQMSKVIFFLNVHLSPRVSNFMVHSDLLSIVRMRMRLPLASMMGYEPICAILILIYPIEENRNRVIDRRRNRTLRPCLYVMFLACFCQPAPLVLFSFCA